MAVRWISYLRKQELEAYLSALGAPVEGRVSDLRKRLASLARSAQGETLQTIEKWEEEFWAGREGSDELIPDDEEESVTLPGPSHQSTQVTEEIILVDQQLSTNGVPVTTGSLAYSWKKNPSMICASQSSPYTAPIENQQSIWSVSQYPNIKDLLMKPTKRTTIDDTPPNGGNAPNSMATQPSVHTRPSSFTQIPSSTFAYSGNLSDLMSTVRKWNLKFSASGEDAVAFLEDLTENGESHGIPKDFLINALPVLLEGRARAWFRNYRETITSWEAFIDQFSLFFIPEKIQLQRENELYEFRQGYRQPVKEYILQIEELMRWLPLNQTQKLERIYNNMSLGYKLNIRRQDFHTLRELIQLAVEYESKISETRPPRTAIGSSSNTNFKPVSSTKVEINPRTLAQLQSNYDRNRCCWNCGQEGHRHPECKEPKRKTCSYCFAQDMLTRDCKCDQKRRATTENSRTQPTYTLCHKDFKDISSPDSRPFIISEINQKKFLSLIDTGSTRSYINEETEAWLREQNWQGTSRKSKISLANGDNIETSTMYRVDVKILNRTLKLEFLLLKGMHESVLLGVDAVKKFKLTLDFSQENPLVEEKITCSSLTSREKLSEKEKAELEEFLSRELSSFENISDLCNAGEHTIIMKHSEPSKQKYYPRNPKMQSIINEQINELLKEKLIEPSKSAYSSPIVLVKKKAGTWRMCVDYRQLNENSVKDAYPIPIIQNILSKLREANFISTLDLKSGYWQIPIKAESRHLTAFTVPGRGLFQWKVMPFGLHSAPATFQRILDSIIGPEMDPFAIAYLDDIIISSKTFKDHICHLAKVFQKLRDHNLRINIEKCTFCTSEIKYLGHLVCEEGIKTDPEKTKAIKEMPAPTTVKGVRQFIGLCSWYRCFISNFSDISTPLTQLMKKNAKFHWGQEQQNAFDTLKERICQDTVISCPDYTAQFFFQTDASNDGLGAVLFQRDSKDQERVIAFISRTLRKAERNYSATEKECLGVFWAISKLKPYLEGYKFTVITDHQSLKWLWTLKSPTGRLDRWAAVLREYDFDIEYRKGKQNVVPDTLSRNPLPCPMEEENFEHLNLRVCNLNDSEDWTEKKRIQICKNPEKFSDFQEINGKLFRHIPSGMTESEDWKLCVPRALINQIFLENHVNTTAGHAGTNKTIHRITSKYFWPGMYRDIKRCIANCESCILYKANQVGPAGYAHSTQTNEPWEVITIDFIGPLPRSKKGHTMLLVFHDKHTKWSEFSPLRAATSVSLINSFRERIISRFGCPKIVITDNGSQFISTKFKQFLASNGIRQQFTPPYTPQCNPTERVNRVIKTIMAQYAVKHKNWDEYLPELQMAYNTSIHEATQFSPAFLNYGRILRHPKNTYDEVLDGKKLHTQSDEDRIRNLKDIRELVKNILSKTKKDQQRHYNLRRRNWAPQIGDKIYIKNHVLSSAENKFNAKLAPKFKGPYRVEGFLSPTIIEIRNLETNKKSTSHIQDIKTIETPKNQ